MLMKIGGILRKIMKTELDEDYQLIIINNQSRKCEKLGGNCVKALWSYECLIINTRKE